jgi:hypothetical protein
MKHIPEKNFIDSTISRLNFIAPGWINGDEEIAYKKIGSADIVNHILKIAIEVKDDSIVNLPPPGSSSNTDLGRVSKRYQRDIEKANKKFRNYRDYQSIVLIRHLTRSSKHTFAYLIGGFITLTPLGRLPNTEKNISRHSESCSVYAFLNPYWCDDLIAYRNPGSTRNSDKAIDILKHLYKNFDEVTQEDLWSLNLCTRGVENE